MTDQMQTNQGVAPSHTSSKWRGMLRVAFVALILAGSVFGVGKALHWMAEAGKPVRATGRVTWASKPVTVGVVTAQSIANPAVAVISRLDEDGRFDLMTNLEPGVLPGTYKVVISSTDGGMVPQSLVPNIYSSFGTTPLQIEVLPNQENNFDIVLEGSLPPRMKSPAEASGDPNLANEMPDSISENETPTQE